MTLVIFNTTQQTTWHIKHPRFSLWWTAKVTRIDQFASSWFIFSNARNNLEQSSLSWTWNPTTLYKRSARSRDDTYYSNLLWKERSASILWPDAVSSNWRFINRNPGVLLSRTIRFVQDGDDNDMGASPNLHILLEFKIRKHPVARSSELLLAQGLAWNFHNEITSCWSYHS